MVVNSAFKDNKLWDLFRISSTCLGTVAMYFSSALWYCTADRAPVATLARPSVSRPSVKIVFQKLSCLCFWKNYLSTLSPDYFFTVSVTWDQMGVKISNDISSESTASDSHVTKTCIVLHTPKGEGVSLPKLFTEL